MLPANVYDAPKSYKQSFQPYPKSCLGGDLAYISTLGFQYFPNSEGDLRHAVPHCPCVSYVAILKPNCFLLYSAGIFDISDYEFVSLEMMV